MYRDMRPRDEMACVHVLACVNVMMGTPSVSNCRLFDFFFTPNLTTRLIQKFVQNIISFVVACFINISFFKNDLNLTMFVQFFLNKTSGQTWGQKSQTNYNLEWRKY